MKKLLLVSCMTMVLGLYSCGVTSVDETGSNSGDSENPGTDDPDDPDKPALDDLFENYLLHNFDTDGDGQISAREADEVYSINCSDMKIKTLTGIGRFRNLTELDCSYNHLTTLDLSHNRQLVTLNCSVNSIEQLKLSGCSQLTEVSCNRNNLPSLDLSACDNLLTLDCAENQIIELDVGTCTYLNYLNCMDNNMSTVWLAPGQKVEEIEIIKDAETCIQYRDLPTDAFQLYLLETFDTDGDMLLSNVEIQNISAIDCSGQIFTTLNGLAQLTNLQTLICEGCKLTELDLSQNSRLTRVNCSNNQLTVLDVSKNRSLTELDCRQNQIEELWLEWTQIIPKCNKDAITQILFYNKPNYFAPGDWYDDGNGVCGIVFDSHKLLALKHNNSVWCSTRYKSTFLGATSTTDGAANMEKVRRESFFDELYIFSSIIDNYGDGWYPLAKEEVQAILDNLTAINKGLAAYGGLPIPSYINSSSEISSTTFWGYSSGATKPWEEMSKESSVPSLVGHTF